MKLSMNRPLKSYRIWHAPRVGSSLLCKLLEATNKAGMPGEHITLHGEANLREKYKVETYEALQQKIWQVSTGGQNIAGLKAGRQKTYDKVVLDELRVLRGLSETVQEKEIWDDIFPNCQHIMLVRNNKIRQAVSWWKAIQDNTWHLTKGQNRTKDEKFYKDKYDFDALSHLYKEAVLREAAAQTYFDEYGIKALTIAYEDLISDTKRVMNIILQFLEIEHEFKDAFSFFYKKTANAHSEEWIQRFKDDLQKGWEKPAW